jgi:hypothetical protein
MSSGEIRHFRSAGARVRFEKVAKAVKSGGLSRKVAENTTTSEPRGDWPRMPSFGVQKVTDPKTKKTRTFFNTPIQPASDIDPNYLPHIGSKNYV